MRNLALFCIFYSFFLLPAEAKAIALHPDSIVQLKPFSVESNRSSSHQAGQKLEKLDSLLIENSGVQNLSDALQRSNALFIKSYGLGSLSTASFRGTTAAQTATLWNGFNLQSPMNGLLDYALVPMSIQDDISISYGGASALFGSSAIGGTILLNNRIKLNSGFLVKVGGSLGSFGNHRQSMQLGWSNEKFGLFVRLFNHQAANNYPFYNTAEIGKPLQYQEHAQLKQQGILAENYIKLTNQQILSIRFWFQDSWREIPADLLSGVSLQEQKDKFYRSTAEWSRKGKRSQTQIRMAHFDEEIVYDDPAIQLHAKSNSKNTILEAENNFAIIPQLIWNLGANATFSRAKGTDYVKEHVAQDRQSIFSALNFEVERLKWKSKLSLRKEHYGSQFAPITLSVGSEKIFLSNWKIRTSVSRNYRIPTFNDLFWKEQMASGNADLKAESGWSGDLGISENFDWKWMSIESDWTVFTSEVKDMIVWTPNSSAIWIPQNINSVWARGLEAKLKLGFKYRKISLEFLPNYAYTLSNENVRYSGNDATYGKQLSYVPKERAQLEGILRFKGFSLSYLHQYTGIRYTTADHSQYLKAFTSGSWQAGKKISFKKLDLNAYFRINNCWNVQYQLLAWRPMPLRHYEGGISISFHSKPK